MRNIIITGAAGGLGQAMVKKFVDQGDFVFAADLHLDRVLELQNQYSNQVKAIVLDVTNEDSVREALQQVASRGNVDVLVNNAGLQYREKIENFPTEQWDLLINVMLTGSFLMTKHAIPYMKEQQYGRIVNISSVHGEMATPEKVAYVAAKHGVIGLTRVTALEGAEFGITANAVLPGPVKTPLLVKQIQDLEGKGMTEAEALAEIMYPKQAMKRFISTEEIADGVYFLSSNEASGITGENLNISGGM
ncbi:3-hydroxybutyrate dehydrogenase [Viridibacillus sp. FSL R5-0477]|uniref:3-hydroxybutyrate dehydrogenase n=1 Tax=Viridibacillus arenosi FSL R5-213 TaxID=1227360 RepID=W4ENZ5_9BACL|nr:MULTISPECIES: 3-hydroxybutyrate dehydrogenase [Viridibacillus]ETT82328.1 3-hydroxybutyrate dehydrogenase [Viridibacillus arenosi FSL R5-213]